MDWDSALQLATSTLRVSTPLVFAALGGLMSERAGVINIALEGMMLVGALGAAVGSLTLGSPWLGAACGMLAGGGLSLIYGWSVLKLRSNQIVAGTAVNMLAAGISPFVCKLLYASTGNTPSIPMDQRFTIEPVFMAWFLVALLAWGFRFTPWGLWFQFAGEHPSALSAAGVRVGRVRWAAVILSGLLAGLGGATLSIFLSSSFSRGMTAGRGFMALAALIFGKWRPVPAALACLLFGLADAVQIRLQGVVLWGVDPVPVQFIQILPYFLTMVVLAGWVGKSRAPKALGETGE